MKECIIVGQPNSGKTLFALQFAQFSGVKKVDLIGRKTDDTLVCRQYALSEAKTELCSSMLHKTRHIQSFMLTLPIGKGKITFRLHDTCGLIDTIHEDEQLRQGMAQTLAAMRSADLILHVLDSGVSQQNPSLIDQEIYSYGSYKAAYLLLANKMDLPQAKQNLAAIKKFFTKAVILPISALKSQGFQEVKVRVSTALS